VTIVSGHASRTTHRLAGYPPARYRRDHRSPTVRTALAVHRHTTIRWYLVYNGSISTDGQAMRSNPLTDFIGRSLSQPMWNSWWAVRGQGISEFTSRDGDHISSQGRQQSQIIIDGAAPTGSQIFGPIGQTLEGIAQSGLKRSGSLLFRTVSSGHGWD
jgi:hypothetical protein